MFPKLGKTLTNPVAASFAQNANISIGMTGLALAAARNASAD